MGVAARQAGRGWLALLGAVAVALILAGRRLRPTPRSRLLVGFVVVDLVVFTVLGVVEILPGGFGAPAVSAAAPTAQARAATVQTAAVVSAALRPISALGYSGRSVIYDPDLLDSGELPALGQPDLNGVSGNTMASIQGYTSIVDGRYAAATGTIRPPAAGTPPSPRPPFGMVPWTSSTPRCC